MGGHTKGEVASKIVENAVPDIVQLNFLPGNRIFLCFDGVYKCIAPQVLKEHLLEDKKTEQILDLIDSLCKQKADDNYTAIMVKLY